MKKSVPILLVAIMITGMATGNLYGRRGRGGGRRGGGRRHHRGGPGFRRGGIVAGSLWGRPGWKWGWERQYWGSEGNWLEDDGLSPEKRWPRIYNETGESVRFRVSKKRHDTYTLTVKTQNGQKKKFRKLQLPEMKQVSVFIDEEEELQVKPK